MSLDIAVIAGYMVAINIIGIACARVMAVNEAFSVFRPWFVPTGFTVSFAAGSAVNMALKERG